MDAMLTIGALAALSAVTPDTIRYYERLGVLPRPARTAAGYRQYPRGMVRRLELIRNAQRFGFSLVEIAAFLRVRESGGRPCADVRAGAARLLAAADKQIAELQGARRRIRATLRAWDVTLSQTPPDAQARLLETLAPAAQRTSKLLRPCAHLRSS